MLKPTGKQKTDKQIFISLSLYPVGYSLSVSRQELFFFFPGGIFNFPNGSGAHREISFSSSDFFVVVKVY
jgi:hypothetical protein